MYDEIGKALEKPPVYTKTGTAFWDDEHISGQMLKAHLDPEFEGASRKLAFIEQSVEWIKERVPSSSFPSLLDIGCGPGLYAERFAKAGYHVTGIDFSRRSINHAVKSALSQGLNIAYLYQNYLHSFYDFAVMIYCDYGALSTGDRKLLLKNVYRHLKPGGRLLLDVFSMAAYERFQERQTWDLCSEGGFWLDKGYLVLNGYYKYPGCVTLDQTAVITGEGITPYYLWNTYFSRDSLSREAKDAGFSVNSVFSDVSGRPYCPDEPVIAILLEK